MTVYDLKAKIAEAKKTGPNMSEAQQGGGDYTPPATGLARARLVGYFETGVHEENDFSNPGKTKDREKVDLVFELSGPNHEPTVRDGVTIPIRVTVQETLSFNERANFFKLFAAMNYAGKATHMAELLGEAFVVEVFHKKSADGKKLYANLKGTSETTPPGNGYNIKGTTVQDPLTGKNIALEVAPAITELKAFIWDIADKEMWDSIFIAGEWEERKEGDKVTAPARSKNLIQQKIKSAKNWTACPCYAVVTTGGVEADIPDAEEPEEVMKPVGGAGADPLAGL